MKKISFLTCFVCGLMSSHFTYADNLTEKVRANLMTEQVKHTEREAGFTEIEADIESQWLSLKAELKQLEQESAALTKTFHQNQTQLQILEKENVGHNHVMQQVFQSVRSLSQALYENPQWHFVYSDAFVNALNGLTQKNSQPTAKTIADFIHHFQEAVSQTNRINLIDLPILQENGQMRNAPVYQLGTVALLGENGFLQWDASLQHARYYPQQEMCAGKSFCEFVTQPVKPDAALITLDPFMGESFFEQEGRFHWMKRVEQSGIVGGIIISLFVFGLGISGVRTFALLNLSRGIARQVKQHDVRLNNPLGRIYAVYEEAKALPHEVLEIKLDEAITLEQQGLEKGLSLVKLFAAVSPMLGLLGTVTGMIQTFQVMSQDDAQSMGLMAQGISLALTTTALGLMVAMPLLFVHNRLQSLVDSIQNTLECVSLGMIAKQIEMTSKRSAISTSVTFQTKSVSHV